MCLLAVPLPAMAQQLPLAAEDPVSKANVHFGPLGLGPRVGLTNLGWDTNVFNEVNDPKQDFTFTVAPGTKLWLRTGRGLLTFDGQADLVYFAEYSSERSVNSHAVGQDQVRLQPVPPVRVGAHAQHARPARVRNRRARPPLRDGVPGRHGLPRGVEIQRAPQFPHGGLHLCG